MACVVRDDRAEILRATSNSFKGRTHAQEAEALSLKEALIWIQSWRTRRCIFALDSKLVVDAIHGERGNSIFHDITDECVILLKHFTGVLICFEYRSANTSLVSTGCVFSVRSKGVVWFRS